jgi:flavin reductase (DIM6/NTAB) family NADH-FMN oxidoreductase RutF
MFFDPDRRDHGLPHNRFKSLIVPRPIGWISTLSPQGIANLAPYSYFTAVCDRPPTVMFASGGSQASDRRRDSQRNAEETGEFVVNLATWDLREAMRATSASVPATSMRWRWRALHPCPVGQGQAAPGGGIAGSLGVPLSDERRGTRERSRGGGRHRHWPRQRHPHQG